MKFIKKRFLLLLVLLSICSSASAEIRYQITHESSANEKWLQCINNHGNCVGLRYESIGLMYGGSYIFPFFMSENGIDESPLYSTRMHKAPYPKTRIVLNDHNQLAFTQATSEKLLGFFKFSFTSQLYRWNPGEQAQLLGAPAGWDYFDLVEINNQGQILIVNSNRYNTSGNSTENERVAYWSDGQFYTISTDQLYMATSITDNGWIFGNTINETKNGLGAPAIYDTNTSTLTVLESPPRTFLKQGNEKGEWIGWIYGADFISPVLGLFSTTEGKINFLPDSFLPYHFNSAGQIFGKKEGKLCIFDLNTHELTMIQAHHLVDKEGHPVADSVLLDANETYVTDCNDQGQILVMIEKRANWLEWANPFRSLNYSFLLTPVQTEEK